MQTIRAKEMLVRAGLEATPARQKILSICLSASAPLSVAEVSKKLGSNAHLATVYRSLEKLCMSGILSRVDFQEGKSRYEYVRDHHHHAVCDNCGSVSEVQNKRLESLMHNLSLQDGFSITRHALELFGLCKNCQKKGTSL